MFWNCNNLHFSKRPDFLDIMGNCTGFYWFCKVFLFYPYLNLCSINDIPLIVNVVYAYPLEDLRGLTKFYCQKYCLKIKSSNLTDSLTSYFDLYTRAKNTILHSKLDFKHQFSSIIVGEKLTFPRNRVKRTHSTLEIGLFKVMWRLFFNSLKKPRNMTLKNQFLGIENSYIFDGANLLHL